MGRLQQVSAFALICSVLGGGCLHLHPDGKSGVKTPAAPDTQTGTKYDPAVEQASAKVPAMMPSASLAALAKSNVKDLPKGAATEIASAWQPKVAALPDPTRNGTPIRGVVGQMFLFGADYQFATANGKVVVEMFDLTGKQAGESGPRLGTWTFEKDAMKKLVTMDEHFGKCYTIFLPWPEYNPAVSRVKLTLRYDPERGYPLYAEESTLTFDNGSNSAPVYQKRTVSGVDAAGFGGLNSPPPSTPRPLPALDPLPVGGRNAQNLPAAPNNPLPPGFPPLVIMPQR